MARTLLGLGWDPAGKKNEHIIQDIEILFIIDFVLSLLFYLIIGFVSMNYFNDINSIFFFEKYVDKTNPKHVKLLRIKKLGDLVFTISLLVVMILLFLFL